MKKFEIVSYNYSNQQIEVQINYPVKQGMLVLKDIDLDSTLYKMTLQDVEPGLFAYIIPTPRHGFDFQRSDFGGFTIELIDNDVILERDMLRFRYTDVYKYKQNMNDYYHPVFMNYREFFVWDRYKDFDLNNCQTVIDIGASVGLFTRYMLNKGATSIASVECDDRSITALIGNFIQNPRVKIIGKAISDTIGEKTLYWRDDNPLVNSLDNIRSEFANIENPNTKIVQSTTLEALIDGLEWSTIDLLKIDIEGSEWDVIASTSDLTFIKANKILLEYHWPNGKLQSVIDRFQLLGFNHKYESGCDGSEENGTIFFSR